MKSGGDMPEYILMEDYGGGFRHDQTGTESQDD